jgi:hypothetical protein
MPEFIFTMQEVTKVHPPDKKVLENAVVSAGSGNRQEPEQSERQRCVVLAAHEIPLPH